MTLKFPAVRCGASRRGAANPTLFGLLLVMGCGSSPAAGEDGLASSESPNAIPSSSATTGTEPEPGLPSGTEQPAPTSHPQTPPMSSASTSVTSPLGPPEAGPSASSDVEPQPFPPTPSSPSDGDGGTGGIGTPPMEPAGAGGGASGARGEGTGGSGAQGGGTGVPVEPASVSIAPDNALWTTVRYYQGGTGASNRTSGPAVGSTQSIEIVNSGPAAPLQVTLEGPDAERFFIESNVPVELDGTLVLDIRVETNNAMLGAAPTQNEGATVLLADLRVSVGQTEVSARLYALVLTYVELEPTFGQILDAFPQYDSMLPESLRNEANPNPATLPGVEAGTDEVAAPVFSRVSPDEPVVMLALARFSPPGLVPFGTYTPGDGDAREEVGRLAVQDDPHTNDKSRLLLPPLDDGSESFVPTAEPFGIFMEPEGVGALFTEDELNFDGQHRIKVFRVRDEAGEIVPNTFLIGGEEASNGDYQDYMFVLSNVQPGEAP